MGFFLVYILKSAFCLTLFYLFYRLLLSKETFHRFNRFTLLGILSLSLFLPLIEINSSGSECRAGIVFVSGSRPIGNGCRIGVCR